MEQKLNVFENKVVKQVPWAKRDGIIGEWRELHNAEHCIIRIL